MKRINKKLLLITSLAVLVPLFLGLILWNRLPDRMTTHWNAAGEADGYSGKGFAVFFTPLFLLVMHLVCVGATLLDNSNKKQSPKALYVAYWAMPVVSLYAGYAIYGTALGISLNASQCLNLMMGVLFLLIGNYLPKTRQNKTVGIRLPWTLKSEENWHKTHRLAGKVWMLGGLLLVLSVFLMPLQGQIIALLIVLGAIVIVLTAYSWQLHKKEKGL